VSDDITTRLRRDCMSLIADEAADEIERLRAELAKYKRNFCRLSIRDVAYAGAKWKIRPNPMRDDGVFIEEDADFDKKKTYFAFPCQFAHDDAKFIVDLLNSITDDTR